MRAESEILEAAHAAIARQDWAEAVGLLAEPAAAPGAGPDLLLAYAEAAWWTSRLEECIQARERAYAALEPVDARQAALVALLLHDNHTFKGRRAVARGWLQRAKRLLDGGGDGSLEAGWLCIREAEHAHADGELDLAATLAESATEIGRRFQDADLEADGLQCQGRILIARGEPTAGLALYDEAMLLAVEGRLGPFATGKVYCSLISACEELGDVQRVAEWTSVGAAWSEHHPFAVFPGLCRVHRAELLQQRGAWSEAEAEARQATTELCDVNLFNAGAGFYEIGEIRRRLGDLDGADEAFARADELGYEPQPGLALLRVAQGRVDAGRTSIMHALAGRGAWNRLGRAKLLPAAVEITIAAGDLRAASDAVTELESVAEDFGTPSLRAAAVTARGRIALARGEHERACALLRGAAHEWQRVDAPYEVAATRVLLGRASLAAGDRDSADAAFDAAAAIFHRLGAHQEAEAVRAGTTAGAPLPDGLTAREAEVLRLVAMGLTNKQVAADLSLSEKTVAHHVSSILSKLGVTSRGAAAAYAFERGIAGAARR